MRPSPGTANNAAVSYTHLDVYKRQLLIHKNMFVRHGPGAHGDELPVFVLIRTGHANISIKICQCHILQIALAFKMIVRKVALTANR